MTHRLIVTLAAVLLVGLIAAHDAHGAEAAGNLPEGYVSVKDYGAVGDGKADDTAAIRKAIEAAEIPFNPTAAPPGVIYFPPGHYRVTETLKLATRNNKLVFQGAGGVSWFGGSPGEKRRHPFARTQIIYDGPEGGTLFDVYGVQGLEFRNLAMLGSKKAGVLLRGNSPRGSASGRWLVQRCVFINADTAIELGAETKINSDTMTFIDVFMRNLKTGFRTMCDQNVQYMFMRVDALNVETAYHIVEGGAVNWIAAFARQCDTVIRIDSGGINTGIYNAQSLKVEGLISKKKRSVVLRARGEVNVNFTSLNLVTAGAQHDLETASFDIGPGVQVGVDNSMLTGRIATLTGGEPTDLPAFIRFDNCRFRCNADPRKKIALKGHAGFVLRDCMITVDEFTPEDYTVHSKEYVDEYRRMSK